MILVPHWRLVKLGSWNDIQNNCLKSKLDCTNTPRLSKHNSSLPHFIFGILNPLPHTALQLTFIELSQISAICWNSIVFIIFPGCTKSCQDIHFWKSVPAKVAYDCCHTDDFYYSFSMCMRIKIEYYMANEIVVTLSIPSHINDPPRGKVSCIFLATNRLHKQSVSCRIYDLPTIICRYNERIEMYGLFW